MHSDDYIEVCGALEHNLKNINVRIPKHSLVVITGVSGSGKSSLAFDTLYVEGQRRYLASFSAYARQFIGHLRRANVEQIRGLSPVVAIEQKTISKHLRSTVGTITEIYDFMRLLFARIGVAHSFVTGKEMVRFTQEEMMDTIYRDYKDQKIRILSPLIRNRKGHYRELFQQYKAKGYSRMRIDGEIQTITEGLQLDRYKIHNIELIVDTLRVNEQQQLRLQESLSLALRLSDGLVFIMNEADTLRALSLHLICADTGISYEAPSPHTFSFNSPVGYCPHCKGVGAQEEVDIDKIIPDERLSLKAGALKPIGKLNTTATHQLIKSIARKHGIPLDKAYGNLTSRQQDILLYGIEDFSGIAAWIKEAAASPTASLREWAAEFMSLQPCTHCEGTRLKKESLYFRIADHHIVALTDKSTADLMTFFQNLPPLLTQRERIIAKDILKEIRDRLQFLLDVGLGYLRLSLPARALSGGEAQRVRLATQIGTELRGITYILDEPSIGLHQRDNMRLIQALKKLRDLGNSVIVVEHDRDIMLQADYIIDMGPGAGKNGGTIIAKGKPEELLRHKKSATAAFLRTSRTANLSSVRAGNGKQLALFGAKGHNLKNVDISFPLGKLILVTGVSGSGKSSLINDTLYPALLQYCNGVKKKALPYDSISGLEYVDKVIGIDQSPIGRMPRSNPATYCGFFTDIRSLFALLPESRARAYAMGHFSFNVKGGRCEVCQGVGFRVAEMGFLPSVNVPCEACQMKRYNRDILDIRYKGKSIHDVLEMSVAEAAAFFQHIPVLHRKIKILEEVGLGYLPLGQSSVLLSGGEAQRIKLATELLRRQTGKTIYILDEPTTGLHFQDITFLLSVLDKLVDKGNTVIIIEHNMEVIQRADYIIDMGPEGGSAGGEVVATGSPKALLAMKDSSITAFYLHAALYGDG